MNELINFIQMNNLFHKYHVDIFKNMPSSLLRPENEIKDITSKIYKQLNSKKTYTCLFPGCSEKPIKSHSIQKSLLKNIMDSTNHVLNFSLNVQFHLESDITVNQQKIGINDASTFEGYCNKHDTTVFLPIEQEQIDYSNDEHNFLLLYRSIAREYYESRKSYFLSRDIIGEINSTLQPDDIRIPYSIIQLYLQYCEFFWVEKMKESLDSCYLLKRYNCQFKYNHITISKQLPVFANTYFCVQGYKNGKMKQIDITKDLPYSFSITILPNNGHTDVFYAYLEEQEKDLADFLKNFQSENEIELEEFITDTILINSDNFYISPDYWNHIPDLEQKDLLKFFKETVIDREYKIYNTLNLFKYMI